MTVFLRKSTSFVMTLHWYLLTHEGREPKCLNLINLYWKMLLSYGHGSRNVSSFKQIFDSWYSLFYSCRSAIILQEHVLHAISFCRSFSDFNYKYHSSSCCSNIQSMVSLPNVSRIACPLPQRGSSSIRKLTNVHFCVIT